MENIGIIKLRDFKFEPYEIAVDDLAPGLILKFKAKIPMEKHDDLFNLKCQTKERNDYFDVYIDNNQPIKMRFGKLRYSLHKDEAKYYIFLVSKEYSENIYKDKFPPHGLAIRETVAFHQAYIEALESLLIQKNIFSE